MRVLAEMLNALETTIQGDASRQREARLAIDRAQKVAQLLPLVHRTCKPGAETSWLDILSTRRFVAEEPCSGIRENAAGIPRAAYFFLGSGAFPEGLVAFVLGSAAVLSTPSSYSPFDTGSIENHAIPSDATRRSSWDSSAKDRFVMTHVGAGRDLVEFAGPYLAAHFRDPLDYARRSQRSSPDFPPYHGLESISGDRRIWTIEVQVHADVPFDTGGASLVEIVVARHSLLEDIPDDMLRLSRIATLENEVLETVAAGIVLHISRELA